MYCIVLVTLPVSRGKYPSQFWLEGFEYLLNNKRPRLGLIASILSLSEVKTCGLVRPELIRGVKG